MHITEEFLGFALLGAEWVMWLLVGLSLVSIAIMAERAIYFAGVGRGSAALIRDLKALLRARDTDGAKARLSSEKGLAAAVGRAAMEEADRGADAVEEAAAGATAVEKPNLERNLAFLATVGNNAPFIGLFGTVLGIIRSFHDLSLDSQGGAATVMSGISESLVATAIGLLVAIPAVAAFNIFQRRIKRLSGDAAAMVHVILAGLKGREREASR
jgi:biopolymer transport protein ExbB